MDDLKTLLISYSNATEELVKHLINDDYDSLESLLDKRQEIIESMKVLDYTKEEFMHICSELNMLESEKRLNGIMEQKLEDAKKEIKKASSGRNMNNAYNKSFNVDSLFLNKKI